MIRRRDAGKDSSEVKWGQIFIVSRMETKLGEGRLGVIQGQLRSNPNE